MGEAEEKADGRMGEGPKHGRPEENRENLMSAGWQASLVLEGRPASRCVSAAVPLGQEGVEATEGQVCPAPAWRQNTGRQRFRGCHAIHCGVGPDQDHNSRPKRGLSACQVSLRTGCKKNPNPRLEKIRRRLPRHTLKRGGSMRVSGADRTMGAKMITQIIPWRNEDCNCWPELPRK